MNSDDITRSDDAASSDDTTSSDDAASSDDNDTIYDKTMSYRPRRRRGESKEGYKMRGQYYKENVQTMISDEQDQIEKTIGFEFDGAELPPSGGKKTTVVYGLSRKGIQRAKCFQRAQTENGRPDYTDLQKVEAMMMYERGESLDVPDWCDRCTRESGISPKCVVMPEVNGAAIGDGACSNCWYQRNGAACNARGRSRRPKRNRRTMVKRTHLEA